MTSIFYFMVAFFLCRNIYILLPARDRLITSRARIRLSYWAQQLPECKPVDKICCHMMQNIQRRLTLKAPRKIIEQTTVCFYFLFFRENNAWRYMRIVCQADDSHVMSSIISSEKYEWHALKMSSASRDWHFKGQES